MDIIAIIDDRYQQLLTKRTEILSSPAGPLEKHQHIIEAAVSAIEDTATLVRATMFTDQETEIAVFKISLPPFYALIRYHISLRQIEVNKPVGSEQMVRQWYQQQYAAIEQFTIDHLAFYQYYRSASIYLDAIYFTRAGAAATFADEPLSPFLDKACCLPATFKIAVFQANEQLAAVISRSLYLLDHPEQAGREVTDLEWTDSKSGLIELIYALQEKGSFNNGRASLKQITTAFEKIFRVELGNTSRTFQVIMSRKMEYANFLEKLKQRFLQRIDRNEQKHIK